MLIVRCDYHPSFQQIAFADTETGELGEQKLAHGRERRSFIVPWRLPVSKCVWVWKRADTHAGSND
jgi:hypothetical protein